MAEIKTAPVTAVRVDYLDHGSASNAPGSFKYYRQKDRDVAGMIYVCPCGCGRIGAIPIRPAESPSWAWDGNRDAPTLNPSVHDVGHWHGWLRNGVWESC